jgi:hypothetical protein
MVCPRFEYSRFEDFKLWTPKLIFQMIYCGGGGATPIQKTLLMDSASIQSAFQLCFYKEDSVGSVST